MTDDDRQARLSARRGNDARGGGLSLPSHVRHRRLSSLVVAVIVFLLIPGPDNLALVTSTGKAGLRGGLAATLDVIAGDQVLMSRAAAGVAACRRLSAGVSRRAMARRRLPLLARPAHAPRQAGEAPC